MYPTNGWSSVVYTGKMNSSNLPYMDKLMDDLQVKFVYNRGRDL